MYYKIIPYRYLGIDLGGTKIAAAITKPNSNEIAMTLVSPTQSSLGKEQVLSNILQSIENLLKAESVLSSTIRAIGIGVPGRVNLSHILNLPNIPGFDNFDLASYITSRFNRPVIIDNDAKAAATGELLYGAGVGKKDFLFMTVSTGIGGGVVTNGKLVNGHNNSAGEIGHMIIRPGEGGPLCGCGQSGCFEALASGTALTLRFRHELSKAGSSNPEKATTRDLLQAALDGNRLALNLIRENAGFIALGLYNYIQIFDPELIIIGGGISNFGDLLFPEINSQLQSMNRNKSMSMPPVVRSPLGQDSGVLGAVALATEKGSKH